MEALDLHVGRPVRRHGLTVFPVWNGRAVTRRGYDLGSAQLEVGERAAAPVVGELVVANRGTRPALLLEGELLEGGLQHRVAARSMVIDAGRTEVLQVRCVEEGRWAGPTAHRRSGTRAPLSVRSARQQSRTWQRVRSFEDTHGSGGGTHCLNDALRDVQDTARRLVAGLEPLAFQSGLLVGIGGHPVQLEVFDSPRTLTSAWGALLQATAVDALGAPAIATPGWAARAFVEQVALTRHLRPDTDGTHRSPSAELTCLSWRDRVVHAVAVNPCHELVGA